MSSKRPVANLVALVEGPNDKTRYLEIGALWVTAKGTLSGTIELEPVAWKDPAVPRNVIISPLKDVTIRVEDER